MCETEAANLGLSDMRLAAITSAAQAAAVATAVGTSNSYWLGATDSASEGTWSWTTGACWTGYTNWASDAPSSNKSQNCAMVSPGGTWQDVECSTTTSLFVLLCSSTFTGETAHSQAQPNR